MRRLCCCFLLFTVVALADGPGDNKVDAVRPVPPPGVKIPPADRAELEKGAAELRKLIDGIQFKDAAHIADVEVYWKAVDWALRYDEFFDVKEVATAKKLLKTGTDRAKALAVGKHPWTEAKGQVVRGYVSKIDGSVQPYGLVVPASYDFAGQKPHRLDLWCHGRGEKLSELSFISGREGGPGDFTPPDAFVLHLYGRYCCANKLAGEIDAFEAMADVAKNYRIDPKRIVMRGFSMGGAAAWHFAVHYPDKWVAAAPGAGFSETADFLKVFQSETVQPTDYEKKLWHIYDCTDYAVNLFNLPTIAYSGEIDKQKQAADMMAKALEAEGMKLNHLIGPMTAHKYHPETKIELNKQIDAIAAKGQDPLPKEVKFTTWTLRYNKSFWVQIDGMTEHFTRARVDAKITDTGFEAKTVGISAITFAIPTGLAPFGHRNMLTVNIDGTALSAGFGKGDGSATAHLRKVGDKWEAVNEIDDSVRKKHGLQGPIDDAFLDRFVFVRPTGKPATDAAGKWVAAEMAHAVKHWRQQYRGDVIVVDDTAVTPEMVANANLILWGDASSNGVLAVIAKNLPLKELAAKGNANTIPVMIYPNPANPKKYVVLNSGFTFREYDYLNNARQIPKLPDWALVDVTTPMTSRAPGKIVAAGFFDENWKLK